MPIYRIASTPPPDINIYPLVVQQNHPTIPNAMVVFVGTIIAAYDGPLTIYDIRPDPFSGIQYMDVGGLWVRENGIIPLGARVLWTAGAEPHWRYATILRYWVE